MILLILSRLFEKHRRRIHSYFLLGLTSALILILSFSTAAASDLDKPNQRPWVMHHISDDYLIANSIFPGDVDKDGCLDYSVIDEAAGTQTILFHPGKSGDVRQPWYRLVLAKTNNPEYSCLADLDGDGNLDLVVVEGDDNEKGFETGLRIVFGPNVENVKDASKWTDAGHVPGTEGEQYLYCRPVDINGDGITEVVFGGRRHPVTKKYAGLRWLQVPQEAEKRRDLSQYKVYFIDPEVTSAHGFVPSDIDEDGDVDILDANPDWDTSLFDQEVYWYENPGGDSPDLYKPWKKHSIWKTTQFYPKPQTGLGDVNKDGHEDIVTQTQNYVHIFLKKSIQPLQWEHVSIMKPDMIQWISRPILFCDVDMDGNLDIVGALIHNDGNLPKDKASVFWMRHTGEDFAKGWECYPIKWSDGYNSHDQWIGEKWDHLFPTDVDGDGDTDLVGNVEEHYRWVEGEPKSFFSVVWFENPTR